MKIVGAGMAGLLAGNMLARHKPVLQEAKPQLPNNHTAVLRFRTAVVGDVVGIPFKKVMMIKDTLPWRNSVADSLAYSHKNLNIYRSDRSVNSGYVAEERYIAPSNFIELLAQDLNIEFNRALLQGNLPFSGPIISTIPMPALMKILQYPEDVKFNYHPGINLRAKIRNCDAYVSLLIPDPDFDFSRISITGDELIVEIPNALAIDEYQAECLLHEASELLGIDKTDLFEFSISKNLYSKIAPIDDSVRKDFIYWATDKFGIYSLGRYATWRPNLLLDSLVNDIRLIERWIYQPSKYNMRKAQT